MKLSKFSNLTILLADDHPSFRLALKNIIRLLGFNGSILEAGNGRQVLDLDRKYTVDLYILDYCMPKLNGYEAAKALLKENPRAKIVMISQFDEPELVNGFYRIGIQRYLDKRSEIDEIETALVNVLKGHDKTDSNDQEYYIPSKNNIIQLTKRERELIGLLTKGYSTCDISELLSLTPKTVETYRCRLLDKAKVRNTSELLHYVHRMGLI